MEFTEKVYRSKLGEGTIKKAKSISKKITYFDEKPVINGSRGDQYNILPDTTHGLVCVFAQDNHELCQGWKFSGKPKECKHIIAFRLSQGQTIEYFDKENNLQEIKL